MKTKFFIVITVLFMSLIGYNVYLTHNTNTMSDLYLSNIEALANPEIKPGDACYSDAQYDANEPKAVKCGSPCTYEPLDIPWMADKSYCL